MTTPALIRKWEAQRATLTDAEIARRSNVTRQAVHAALGRRPAPPPKPKIKAPKPVPDANEKLPEALFKWRSARGMTQEQAAAQIRIVSTTWSTWERRSRSCKMPGLVLLLLEALDRLAKFEKTD